MKKRLFASLLVCSLLTGLALSINTKEKEAFIEGSYDALQETRGFDVKKAFIGGEEATLSFSKTYSQYGKTSDGKYVLRFATAIRGNIENVNYVRYGIGLERKVTPVTTVYKGILAGDKTYYYNGSEITNDESAAGNYYWACYSIKFDNEEKWRDTNIVAQLEITDTNENVSTSEAKSSSLDGLIKADTQAEQYPYSVTLVQAIDNPGSWFRIIIEWTKSEYMVSDKNNVIMHYSVNGNDVKERPDRVNNAYQNGNSLIIDRDFDSAAYLNSNCTFYATIINDAGNKYNISLDFYGAVTSTANTIMPSKSLVSSVEKLEKINVTFDANGGTFSDGSNIMNQEVLAGLQYGELPTPEYQGHRFDGWWTEQDAGNQITSSSIVEASTSITLYAHWISEAENPAKELGFYYAGIDAQRNHIEGSGVWVWFDTNSISMTPANWTEFKIEDVAISDSSFTITDPKPFISDLNFDNGFARIYFGMNKGNGENDKLSFTIKISHGSDLYVGTITFVGNELFVDAGEEEQIQINFDANEGTLVNPEDATRSYYANRPYGELPQVSRENYLFDGWYTEKEAGTKVNATDACKLENGTTLYAHWISVADVPLYDVVIDDGAGAWFRVKLTWGNDAQDITSYKDIEVKLTRQSGSEEPFVGFMNVTEDHNDSNYAVFGCSFASAEFTGGASTLELEVPTLSGEYYLVSCTVTYENSKFVASNTSVKAIEYTNVSINFDANEGTLVNPEDATRIYTKNKNFGELPQATRENYAFDGWYTEKEAGTKVTANDICELENGTTLYAHWISEADVSLYDVAIETGGGAWFRVKLTWGNDAQDITTYKDIKVKLTRPNGSEEPFVSFMDKQDDYNDSNYAVFGCSFGTAEFLGGVCKLELEVTAASGQKYLVSCSMDPTKSYEISNVTTTLL